MTKQQILVIHGGTTFQNREEYLDFLETCPIDLEKLRSKKDWKGSLQDKLGDNYDVLQPKMPDSTNAQYSEWKTWFDKIISLLDDGVILIGHSLGGIFLAKYLAENTCPKKIKSLLLVAAPFEDDIDLGESLGSFLPIGSFKKIEEQVKNIFLYYSRDDKTVSVSHGEKYQADLPEAKLRIFEDRGHFKIADFPELLADIG